MPFSWQTALLRALMAWPTQSRNGSPMTVAPTLQIHYFGAFSFMLLVIIYSAFIIETYVYGEVEEGKKLLVPMLFLMVYPVAYDFT